MLFSKKEEVNLDDFCHGYYEKNILNPVIVGINANVALVDTIKRNVVEADNNFANINSQELAAEVVLIRFELFALAWLHQFGEKLAIAQSTFTKRYLQEKKRDDIWNNSETYNQAIARSITLGKTPSKPLDRVYLARVDMTRLDSFKRFHKEGYDPICIGRVVNRLFSDEAWAKGITAGLLMFALCDHLGFDSNFEPTKEAQFRLTSVIRLFYDGARESLDKIKIRS
jgi:hypothetical protein